MKQAPWPHKRLLTRAKFVRDARACVCIGADGREAGCAVRRVGDDDAENVF